MFIIKKIIIPLFIVVYAATCSATFSIVSTEHQTNHMLPITTVAGWDLSAKALYLHPTYGGNGLGYSSFGNYSGNDINSVFVGTNGAPDQIYNIFPKWGWGFQLDGTYYFNPLNDVNVTWYHLKESRQASFPVGSLFSGNNDGFYAGQFKVSTFWDETNIELAQYLMVSPNKNFRLNAGVEFARIKNQFINYPLAHPTSTLIYESTDTLSYHGFGPRIGADFRYTVGYGLDLYTKLAGSLLRGTAKQDNTGYQNYFTPLYGVSPYVTSNYQISNSGVIVPELAAKLGVKYNVLTTRYRLSFDLGYLWLDYLNAIPSYTGNGLVFANVGNPSNANFNLNGVYFGVTITG